MDTVRGDWINCLCLHRNMTSTRNHGASQISLGGVTEDESHTDSQEARRRLRQRAEIARGRPEHHSPQYDRFEGRNGIAGRRYRGREYSEEVSDGDRSDRKYPPSSRYSNEGSVSKKDDYSEEEEYDSEEDVKKRLTDEDDEDQRNSFTPVKFHPRSEKELDSIQMNGTDTVQYVKEDDTESIDLSNNGRHLARSMSSFSQPDQKPRPANPTDRYNLQDERGPTPPPPLPMNIPMKPSTPMKPVPPPSLRPVPAPRPKPIPSARSYGSRENMTDMEEKLNNLSQDELSDRNSMDRLDRAGRGGMYDRKMASSREKMTDLEPSSPFGMNYTQAGVGAGIDMLPRSGGNRPNFDTGSDTPIHQSSENLLPKQKNDYNPNKPYREPNRDRENMYMSDPYEPNVNSDSERLMPNRTANPWRDEAGRETPQNSDYSDGTGIQYLPRNPGTPSVPNRYNPGYQQSPPDPHPPSTPGYPSYADSYSPGYDQQYPNNSYHSNRFDSQNSDIGVDYLPRNMNSYNIGAPKQHMSRSKENLSRSRENLAKENLSRSRENLSRSREHLSRSRENMAGYNNEVRENSMDVKKPRQQKSIETEI